MYKVRWFIAGAVIISLTLYFAIPYFFNGTAISLSQLETEDLNSNKVSATAFAGKPVVVIFWGTWCGQCQEEVPLYEKMKNKYEGRVQFILLSDERITKIATFKEKEEITITCLRSLKPFKELSINFVPVIYFFNSKGEFVSKYSGVMNETNLIERINKL